MHRRRVPPPRQPRPDRHAADGRRSRSSSWPIASPTKRADKIEELLETPAYAAWWTTRLCDWTGNNDTKFNNVGTLPQRRPAQQWYDWIYKRVAENVPYDKLVEGIVTGVSRKPGESYAEYCDAMSKI